MYNAAQRHGHEDQTNSGQEGRAASAKHSLGSLPASRERSTTATSLTHADGNSNSRTSHWHSIVMTKDAENNNNKLFPVFIQNLSDGLLASYVPTAEKLSIWLNSSKAYYALARPTIIKLMEAAHDAVRRQSGHPQQSFHISRSTDALKPWAEPFVKIVRTVAPFYPLFTERELQARLRVLIQTICENVDEYLSQIQLVQRESSSAHNVPPNPAVPRMRAPARPTVAERPPAPSLHIDTQVNPQPAPASANAASHHRTATVLSPLAASYGAPIRRGSPAALIPQPTPIRPFPTPSISSHPSTSTQADAPSWVPLAARTSTTPSSAASSTVPTPASSANLQSAKTTSKHKAKAKKKIVLEDDFIQADLDWFKDTEEHRQSERRDTSVSSQTKQPGSAAGADGAVSSKVVPEPVEKPPDAAVEDAGQKQVESSQSAVMDNAAEAMAEKIKQVSQDTTITDTDALMTEPELSHELVQVPTDVVMVDSTQEPTIKSSRPISDLQVQTPVEDANDVVMREPEEEPIDAVMDLPEEKPAVKEAEGTLGTVESVTDEPDEQWVESIVTAIDDAVEEPPEATTNEVAECPAEDLVESDVIMVEPVEEALTNPLDSTIHEPDEAQGVHGGSVAPERLETAITPSSVPGRLSDTPIVEMDQTAEVQIKTPSLPVAVKTEEVEPADAAFATSLKRRRTSVVVADSAAGTSAINDRSSPERRASTPVSSKRSRIFNGEPDTDILSAPHSLSPPPEQPRASGSPSPGALEMHTGDTLTMDVEKTTSAPQEPPPNSDVALQVPQGTSMMDSESTAENKAPLRNPPAPRLSRGFRPKAPAQKVVPLNTATSSGMTRVLACARGSEKSSATLELEFRLSDEQAAQLARWAKRYDTDEDVSTSKCVSLACYTYSQCISYATKHPNAQALDCGPPTTWPADGRLYAALDTGEGARTILLSPRSIALRITALI
ncbi:hypothetical protein A0H81_13723 [Grifola frondosa]|uniref:Uncharacterized protein n=1 Tax=Grifola frondosa TaxID=5627 RepID=A0A1C7LN98_GRIFR|nr:hypothetical protein A0H81_13723 [Grifola frondosa]